VKAVKAQAIRGTGGRILLTATACGALFYAFLIFAYNPIQDKTTFDGAFVAVHARWANATMTWELNPAAGSNVTTTNGTSMPVAISNAFATWNTTLLNGQLLTNLAIRQGSNTTLTDPNESDCQNIISFVPSSSVNFPTGTIAFTEVATAVLLPGQTSPCGDMNSTQGPVSFIISADTLFSPKMDFSTTTPPLPGDFDVQALATHEFGHALGLDHSGIAHAVMYPFADSGQGQQRNLAVDDVIGIAFIYPGTNFATATGTISGKITLTGNGIFAAHVVVVDANTGAAVVDGLTNTDGTYKLVGVPPGSYEVLALPLAKDANSGVYTLDNFWGWSCGYSENSPPCCDSKQLTCTGQLQNPTSYTGKFF
jgi:hypothetical protein